MNQRFYGQVVGFAKILKLQKFDLEYNGLTLKILLKFDPRHLCLSVKVHTLVKIYGYESEHLEITEEMVKFETFNLQNEGQGHSRID